MAAHEQRQGASSQPSDPPLQLPPLIVKNDDLLPVLHTSADFSGVGLRGRRCGRRAALSRP